MIVYYTLLTLVQLVEETLIGIMGVQSRGCCGLIRSAHLGQLSMLGCSCVRYAGSLTNDLKLWFSSDPGLWLLIILRRYTGFARFTHTIHKDGLNCPAFLFINMSIIVILAWDGFDRLFARVLHSSSVQLGYTRYIVEVLSVVQQSTWF